MNFIEYFSCNNPEHWLSQIGKSDWGAGTYLQSLLRDGKLRELCGEKTTVWMLVDGDELLSFCTLAEQDDIQPTELTPWIGFVYTFPAHRGKGYAGQLISRAEKAAAEQGLRQVYISTNHVGLYERYGYRFLRSMKDIGGEDSRVYVKQLS